VWKVGDSINSNRFVSFAGLRAFVVGTSYQLGNLVSSASSTIEATIGETFPLPDKIEKGKKVSRYEYGKVVSFERHPYAGVISTWLT
jgi:hypothetical protein